MAAGAARGGREEPRSARTGPGAALPVAQAYDLLLEMCAKHATVVVVGETGSGKSTQIPQFLMEQRTFGGRVAVTQPRRVAAVSLAQRVCWERKCKLGTLVGYCVRFDDRTSRKTRLRFLTDGMLLREAMLDPQLLKYSVVILDEAHERSLGTDILFGIVRRAQRARRAGRMPLRVVVMSATLDVRTFLDFFKPGDAAPEDPFERPVAVHIQGRQFGVQVLYAETGQKDYLDAAVVAAIQAHLDEDLPGDILIFLTGQEEIEACAELLEERARRLPADAAAKLLVCPIFAALPAHEQMRVFEPAPEGARKVVLATNIAETSITIPGVRIVIDTGMVKAKAFSAASGLELLQVVPTSQEQAWQRTGRAGREGPGKCFRLYPESAFFKLRPRTVPEIKRVELSQVVLQLLVLGVADIHQFDFVDAPPKAALAQALFNLVALGAVRIPSRHEAAAATVPEEEDSALDGAAAAAAAAAARLPQLTDLGRRMASLPLEPMHAKFLLDAARFGCVDQALSVASMCSVESPFYTPRSARRDAIEAHARFASFEADHLTLLNVFEGFRDAKASKEWCKASFLKFGTLIKAKRVRDQLVAMLEKDLAALQSNGAAPASAASKDDDDAAENLLRCLVSGFPLRIAQRLPPDGVVPGTRYRTTSEGIEARIHPSSSLARRDPMPEWVVFNELVHTSKKYLKMVAAVDQSWLVDCAPHLFKPSAIKTPSPAAAVQTPRASHAQRRPRPHETTAPSETKDARIAKRRALLMCD